MSIQYPLKINRIQVLRKPKRRATVLGMITLRDYQLSGIQSIRAEFAAGRRRVLFVLPTGGGKTVTFSWIAQQTAIRGRRVGIFVHRAELVEQVCETLRMFNVPHGVICADQPMARGMNCYVVSVQTYVRRVPQVPRFDLCIVDEAHHAVAGSTWDKSLAHSRNATVLGVTATPERLDGKGLGDTFEAMVQGPTVRQLIDAGSLCDYKLVVPPAVDLSGVHTRMGDYVRGEAAAAVDKPTITGDAIGHYRKHADGKRAVAFTCSVAHAQHAADEFMRAGIPAIAIDGGMDKSLRRSAVRDFKDGRIRALMSCDLISEGFDLPAIEAAILLRPTQSTGLYLQQVGRALRTFPGKDRAIIIDHVGNSGRSDGGAFYANHGLPDDERAWSLDGREITKRGAKSEVQAGRRCPKCFSIARFGAMKCGCGFVFTVEARAVEQVDGSLHEVDADAVRRSATNERLKEQASARSIESLTELGRLRGMKNPAAWARHVWEARQRKGVGR